jgi:hypothetical protein
MDVDCGHSLIAPRKALCQSIMPQDFELPPNFPKHNALTTTPSPIHSIVKDMQKLNIYSKIKFGCKDALSYRLSNQS